MTPVPPLLLAVELSGAGVRPASWRRADSRAEDLFTPGYWVDAASAADCAGLDIEARAEAENLSIRELIIEVTARQQFVDSPAQVAAEIDRYVQEDAADGFILMPHLTPAGLDEFVDKVVPELQDRGNFRTEYTGTTLREHLGLRHPHRADEKVRAS